MQNKMKETLTFNLTLTILFLVQGQENLVYAQGNVMTDYQAPAWSPDGKEV